MKSGSPRTAFTINAQPVSWSVWRLVLCKYAHRDPDLAGRFFYRAAMRQPADIVPYLIRGLQKNGYIWEAHFDETERPDMVRKWIEANITQAIHGKGKGGQPTQLKHDLAAALRSMAQEIEGGAHV
jgi:hypothetical protein